MWLPLPFRQLLQISVSLGGLLLKKKSSGGNVQIFEEFKGYLCQLAFNLLLGQFFNLKFDDTCQVCIGLQTKSTG